MFDDGILATPPPNDTGSLTFARYCYQARVAFRYALTCASGRTVDLIVPEHFEDLAVHLEIGEWHLIQIKTRDLGYGPWCLADVVGADGAFRSLLRAFRALPRDGLAATLIAYLEGAIEHGDDLEQFVGSPCTDPAVSARVRERLGLTDDEAREFVPHLRVAPESPRSTIDAMNIRRLGACMPNRRHAEIEAVYREALALIQLAMEAALLGPDWALQVIQPSDDAARERVRSKSLDRVRLASLASQLGADPAPLLSRLIGASQSPPTRLEEKLLAGGALSEVIRSALEMRARADHWALERMAASLWPEDEVTEDVDVRLGYLATAAVARHAADPQPANGAWADVHDRLTRDAATHDPRMVYAQEPVLLMGRVCSLSDECVFEWRGTRA